MDGNLQSRVEDLRRQLLAAGYHGFQVDDMYKDTVGMTKLNGLDNDQLKLLIDVLSEQVVFASKCCSNKKR